MVVLAMKPRLLVIELHHLGDAVMSLPFVRGAQRKFEVHVLCRPSVGPIYRLPAETPHIHEWEPPWSDDKNCGALAAIRAANAAGRNFAAEKFELAVGVWADARVELIMAATRAKQRVGFPMTRGNYYAANLPWRSKRLVAGQLLENIYSLAGPVRPLLNSWLHREDVRQHHSRCWEQVAGAIGINCEYNIPWIAVEPSSEVSALRAEAAANGKMLLAVHAHARLPSKQWQVENWRALLGLAALREKFGLMQIVPPGAQAVSDNIPVVAPPDVRSLASALAAADAVVCHDSLPGHLAAALGKPVVTVFGSGEPDWFAPWNNRDRVVQRRVCPLHPCIDRCGMDSYLCLDAVAVDDVAVKVMEIAGNK
jgi:ADP-heptose:LPS heptosyltransferase